MTKYGKANPVDKFELVLTLATQSSATLAS